MLPPQLGHLLSVSSWSLPQHWQRTFSARYSANVLKMLGYRIRWRGINSEQAEVYVDTKNCVE